MAFEKAEIGTDLHTIPHEAWDQQASDTVPLAKLNAQETFTARRRDLLGRKPLKSR